MNTPLPDLLVIVAYITGVVLFGLWIGRGQRGVADYMLGGRDLPWWVVLFSIVATETSTVTFLSIPGFASPADLTWLQLPMGYVLGRLLVVSLLLPRLLRGEMLHRLRGAPAALRRGDRSRSRRCSSSSPAPSPTGCGCS